MNQPNQRPLSATEKALDAQKATDRQAVRQIYDYYMKRKGSLWSVKGLSEWVFETMNDVLKEDAEREKAKAKK